MKAALVEVLICLPQPSAFVGKPPGRLFYELGSVGLLDMGYTDHPGRPSRIPPGIQIVLFYAGNASSMKGVDFVKDQCDDFPLMGAAEVAPHLRPWLALFLQQEKEHAHPYAHYLRKISLLCDGGWCPSDPYTTDA